MTEIVTVRYKLVGPHAGKTINLGKKFQFENGYLEMQPTREDQKHQYDGLTRHLARAYNAHPEGSKALEKAEADWALNPANKKGAKPAAAPAPKPAKETKKPEPEKDEGDEDNEGEEDGEGEELTLADALNKLNPDDDSHWTKTGLPNLQVLNEWMGRKVGRDEIEEVSAGFNREIAAAAEQE